MAPPGRSVFLVIFIVLVLDLNLCFSGSMPPSSVCKLPESAVRWDSNPEMILTEVFWGPGSRSICYTTQACFGIDAPTPNNQSDEGTSQDSIAVQLLPVQLQKGNRLRFHTKRYKTNMAYPDIYRVNETAFGVCDTTFGTRIEKTGEKDAINVPSELLQYGSNYFIIDDKSLISCYLGLRLNVTVKQENCTGRDLDACGGRGLCVTNKHQPDFACHCCGTYKGDNCSIFDACLSYPCQNGGECLQSDNNTQGYQCKCPIGYYGENCELKTHNLCDIISCKNNGTCSGNATTFECACAPGWAGMECEVNLNECENWPCRHGQCVDKVNGYQCYCYPGYYGPKCEEQHDKCTFGPCEKHGGFCENQTVDSDFKYKCHCPPGTSGVDCSIKISPCEPDPCSARGLCLEAHHSYRCICEPGFTGQRCEVNINDCDPNPCLYGGHCLDLYQGHMCRCIQTHFGSNCQYTQDMFRPDMPGVNTDVVIVQEGVRNRTLTVLAWVLCVGVIVVIILLVSCYCRLTGAYKNICGLRNSENKKSNSDLTVQVNVSNTPECPLSHSFLQGSCTDLGIDNNAFKTEVV